MWIWQIRPGAGAGAQAATAGTALFWHQSALHPHNLWCDLRRQGLTDWHAVATVMREVARGLHYMHASGRIHRDLKAANILVAPDGRVALAGTGQPSVATRPSILSMGAGHRGLDGGHLFTGRCASGRAQAPGRGRDVTRTPQKARLCRAVVSRCTRAGGCHAAEGHKGIPKGERPWHFLSQAMDSLHMPV